uniref:Ribosome biogenesis protein NOP53 n=1 Tax=Plectus sambesii TaxID=2011161 RepID=A0A914X1H5_9BILA
MAKATRTGAAKGSRNKKRYWRKGTQLEDVEKFLEEQRVDERSGGRLNTRTDADLFAIDTTKVKGLPTLTRRQRVALAKTTAATAPSTEEVDVKPKIRQSFPSKKKSKVATNSSRPLRRSTRGDVDGKPVDFDLWNTDLSAKAALPDDLADYYLRQLKKKMPNEPRTVKHITTLLPKVEAPIPGASYNPSYKDHQDMLRESLVEEMKVQKDLEKVENRFKLAPGDRYITPVTFSSLMLARDLFH